MRKVVSILSVCLVCLMLCFYAPINGRAFSWNGESSFYSVLQFDSFDTGAYSAPWPFNCASSSVSRDTFNFMDVSSGFISFDGTYINGYLDGLVSSPLILYSASQIVSVSDLSKTNSFVVSSGNTRMTFAYADISCSVVTLTEGSLSDSVFAGAKDVSCRVWCGDNGSLNIGACLADLFYQHNFDTTFVMLRDLKVEFHYSVTDATTPSIMFTAGTRSYDSNLFFQQWVSEQNIVVERPVLSPEFNLGSWLAESVDGFMRVELFPGFSIDKIFYTVLVIGVLLWFIKVIS